MNRLASMPLIAVALLTFLTGCDPDSRRPAIREATQARKAVAPACPTPTASIDALAAEWERLDEGARKCRGAN